MPSNTFWRPIAAAAVALCVVHGLGRFSYTPLLPKLLDDRWLTLSQGAHLASMNYVGYLIGALMALWLYKHGRCKQGLMYSLVLNVLLSVTQPLLPDVASLTISRTLNGLTNGAVFVLAPALVLEWLAMHHKAHKSGWMYLGVSGGIFLSYALIELSAEHLSGSARWWPLGITAIPLAYWAARTLNALPQEIHDTASNDTSPLWDRASTPLFLAYAGAGLGYILPLTFLPAVSRAWHVDLTPSPWVIVAGASIPSVLIWNWLGHKLNDKRALLLNYLMQAASIVALLYIPNHNIALWSCALLMGGSFLGAVLLTQRLARALHPHQGPRLSAALISLYGFTQLTGPWLVAWAIEHGMSLSASFIFGLAALIVAIIGTLFTPAKTH